MMRTFSFILLMGVTMLLLGCGFSGSGEEVQGGDGIEPLVALATPSGTVAPVDFGTPSGTVVPTVETKTPSGTVVPTVERNTPIGAPASLSLAPPAYDGPTSLEERILASPVIARVRLDSTASTVESATIFDGSTKYIALLEFSFSVQEYLKDIVADDIVAVWAAPYFDTQEEAEDALPAIAAARDAQWDDRRPLCSCGTPQSTSRAHSRRDLSSFREKFSSETFPTITTA